MATSTILVFAMIAHAAMASEATNGTAAIDGVCHGKLAEWRTLAYIGGALCCRRQQWWPTGHNGSAGLFEGRECCS